MSNDVYHIPVLLKESVDALQVNENGVYVDLTFGGGGHTREILRRGARKVICFDQDEDARQNIEDTDRIVFVQHNFRFMKFFLRYLEEEKVDGVLADLGVSSHEFDEATRGFSYRFDSPLDMRMNQQAKQTAYDIVNRYDERQLAGILKEYGELSNARTIARTIVLEREKNPVSTTFELAEVVASRILEYKRNAFLSKVFQAIRIEVNDELGALKEVLGQMSEVLKPKGRLAFISYHSLEDRIVKRYIQSGNVQGKIAKDFYGNILSNIKAVGKVQVPTVEEIEQNSRARSAKLRVAERI